MYMTKTTAAQGHLAIVILAAGKGTRMQDAERAKVLFPVAGRPMVDYVVDQALALAPQTILAVVGYKREAVEMHLREHFGGKVDFAIQEQQLGTGHAVMQCRAALNEFDGDVLILSGDVPLLKAETLQSFTEQHRASGASVSVLSVRIPDPSGYGRILRDKAGRFLAIVEHKDADEQTRVIDEINSGIYMVRARHLFAALDSVSNNNRQGEYYLTDIIHILREQGHSVRAFACASWQEVQGINTPEQLAGAEQWMLSPNGRSARGETGANGL